MNLNALCRLVAISLFLGMGLAHAGPVDINSANTEALAEGLTGIGTSRAQAIVEYRDANGPFKKAEDLTNIQGIGMHIVELNRENIEVSKP